MDNGATQFILKEVERNGLLEVSDASTSAIVFQYSQILLKSLSDPVS